jgi:hypothetical protein
VIDATRKERLKLNGHHIEPGNDKKETQGNQRIDTKER